MVSYSQSLLSAPTCIDLFCGAGGLSLAWCQAGGVPVAAVDHDPASIETYQKMFPICRNAYCGNIEDWHSIGESKKVDIMIGGPPCQGFSLARGLRFVDDPRNHLYKQFVRLVSASQPRWLLMENVPGITSIGHGAVLKQIHEDFEEIGYQLKSKVINMAEFGVPQTRRRAIFVGSPDLSHFRWPAPTHVQKDRLSSLLPETLSPWVSVKDALEDLPWPMGNYISHRANSQMRGPRNRTIEQPSFTLRVRGDELALCEAPAGGAFSPGPAPNTELAYGPVSNSFQALMREEAPSWLDSPPVAAKARDKNPAKLRGTRRLSTREQARLQTFPDWFQFSGSEYAQGRQIGNAVPPLFAKILFQQIIESLKEAKLRQDAFCHFSEAFV